MNKPMIKERICPNDPDLPNVFQHHLARYDFVKQYVKDRIVLDAGCGTGYGSIYLVESGGARKVYGIDVSQEAIDYCLNIYQRDNLVFLRKNCTNLDFPDEFFNVVVAFEIIEHIEDDQKFLSEANRVLKKDGTFIVSTPKKHEKHIQENPYHIREYSFDEFNALLSESFSSIEFFGQYVPKFLLAKRGIPLLLKKSLQNTKLLYSKEERRILWQSSKLINFDKVSFLKVNNENKAQYHIAVCRK